MADVKVIDEGCVVGFIPQTPDATEWFEENVGAEPWQHFGAVIYVDHRDAVRIVDGLGDYGLTLGG